MPMSGLMPRPGDAERHEGARDRGTSANLLPVFGTKHRLIVTPVRTNPYGRTKGIEQRIERKGRVGFPLAPLTMTTVHDER